MLRSSLLALTCLLSPALVAQAPQTPAASARKTYQPLLATLAFPLDVSLAKVGTQVTATVQADWTNGSCNLRYGSLIEGHVSQITRRTKTDRNSSMAVVFDRAECDRHRGTPLQILLIALLGPDAPAPGGESGMGQNPPLTDVPNPIGGSTGLRSVSRASNAHAYALTGHSVPNSWKLGMVADIPNTTLTVGKGPGGGSIIAGQNRDARLEAKTLLIMAYLPPADPETAPRSTAP